MRLPDQFRSTSFRLGTIYAGLFLVSVMAILGTTYVAATAEVAGIVRLSVAEDMDAFGEAFRTGGGDALKALVENRVNGGADDHFYLLTDAAGAPIAGNVPPSVWRSGWSEWKVDGATVATSPALKAAAAKNSDREVRLFASGETMGPFHILAARNSHVLDETQEIILAGLLWGSLLTTLLALVGGYVVSIGPTRRVDAIAAAMRLVSDGRFDQRLPVTGRRDELDRLSSDINGMLSRIETLMSSLKQVSTDIAHDLRTPLARMRQRLEGAQREAAEPEDLREAIEGAVLETDSIIETFNALLRIAQIEAGARKAKFRRIDLSELLREIHEVFETVAEEAGHRLIMDVAPGQIIEGDRDLLQQLLANLVENAITHVPPPGSIRLVARRERGFVAVDIADDGPGVPEEERERIFRRLYRLDRSRTTPGNGLGLALAAAIVDLHGGTIRALDGRPGLTMRVSLPLVDRAEPATSSRRVGLTALAPPHPGSADPRLLRGD
ncbi:ATP-binding protein [Aureimonas sp. Leaf454]|uniref:sensor histidine kinase n=1 Tax=Aureimonas sp. Leaf454 TaxID=1736381 RepID=UPI0009EC9CBF|nr:ATP-binding protein [Aureimonas sp. Leaf454]